MVVVEDFEPGSYFYLVNNNDWSPVSKCGQLLPKVEGKYERVLMTVTQTNTCRNRRDCVKVLSALQTKQTGLGLPDIKHNFMISSDGTIYEGRGWTYLPHIEQDLLTKYKKETPSDKRQPKNYAENLGRHFSSSNFENCLQIAYIGSFHNNKGLAKIPTYEMTSAAMTLVKYGMKLNKISTNYTMDFFKPKTIDSLRFFR